MPFSKQLEHRVSDLKLLFELESEEDLARQLCRLYEEPGLLERLRAGIRHVKTVEENVTELEDLYASLLKGTRAG